MALYHPNRPIITISMTCWSYLTMYWPLPKACPFHSKCNYRFCTVCDYVCHWGNNCGREGCGSSTVIRHSWNTFDQDSTILVDLVCTCDGNLKAISGLSILPWQGMATAPSRAAVSCSFGTQGEYDSLSIWDTGKILDVTEVSIHADVPWNRVVFSSVQRIPLV